MDASKLGPLLKDSKNGSIIYTISRAQAALLEQSIRSLTLHNPEVVIQVVERLQSITINLKAR